MCVTSCFSLQALSVSQLEALGPDNAAMVTTEQLAALGDEQQAALERASTGSQEETQDTSESGKRTRVQCSKFTYSSDVF